MRTAKTQDDATKGFSMADKKIFQNMVNQYDSKSYSKGLESAD